MRYLSRLFRPGTALGDVRLAVTAPLHDASVRATAQARILRGRLSVSIAWGVVSSAIMMDLAAGWWRLHLWRPSHWQYMLELWRGAGIPHEVFVFVLAFILLVFGGMVILMFVPSEKIASHLLGSDDPLLALAERLRSFRKKEGSVGQNVHGHSPGGKIAGKAVPGTQQSPALTTPPPAPPPQSSIAASAIAVPAAQAAAAPPPISQPPINSTKSPQPAPPPPAEQAQSQQITATSGPTGSELGLASIPEIELEVPPDGPDELEPEEVELEPPPAADFMEKSPAAPPLAPVAAGDSDVERRGDVVAAVKDMIGAAAEGMFAGARWIFSTPASRSICGTLQVDYVLACDDNEAGAIVFYLVIPVVGAGALQRRPSVQLVPRDDSEWYRGDWRIIRAGQPTRHLGEIELASVTMANEFADLVDGRLGDRVVAVMPLIIIADAALSSSERPLPEIEKEGLGVFLLSQPDSEVDVLRLEDWVASTFGDSPDIISAPADDVLRDWTSRDGIEWEVLAGPIFEGWQP